MLIVYTLAQCSTCRDAVKWLRAQKLPFEERPIRETPPTVPELRRMLAAYDGEIRRLCNSSGLEYRAQNLAEKLPVMTEDEILALLAGNGSLVKRPFLLAPKTGVVGFNEKTWREKLLK